VEILKRERPYNYSVDDKQVLKLAWIGRALNGLLGTGMLGVTGMAGVNALDKGFILPNAEAAAAGNPAQGAAEALIDRPTQHLINSTRERSLDDTFNAAVVSFSDKLNKGVEGFGNVSGNLAAYLGAGSMGSLGALGAYSWLNRNKDRRRRDAERRLWHAEKNLVRAGLDKHEYLARQLELEDQAAKRSRLQFSDYLGPLATLGAGAGLGYLTYSGIKNIMPNIFNRALEGETVKKGNVMGRLAISVPIGAGFAGGLGAGGALMGNNIQDAVKESLTSPDSALVQNLNTTNELLRSYKEPAQNASNAVNLLGAAGIGTGIGALGLVGAYNVLRDKSNARRRDAERYQLRAQDDLTRRNISDDRFFSLQDNIERETKRRGRLRFSDYILPAALGIGGLGIGGLAGYLAHNKLTGKPNTVGALSSSLSNLSGGSRNVWREGLDRSTAWYRAGLRGMGDLVAGRALQPQDARRISADGVSRLGQEAAGVAQNADFYRGQIIEYPKTLNKAFVDTFGAIF